jgi:hypothetical protein
MKKITAIFVVIIVGAILTATVLGLKNGIDSENPQSVPEPPESARDKAIYYILQEH